MRSSLDMLALSWCKNNYGFQHELAMLLRNISGAVRVLAIESAFLFAALVDMQGL